LKAHGKTCEESSRESPPMMMRTPVVGVPFTQCCPEAPQPARTSAATAKETKVGAFTLASIRDGQPP